MFKLFCFSGLTLFCLAFFIHAREKILHHKENADKKDFTFLNINNISTTIFNNGITDIDYNQMNSGLFYPKGNNKAVVFISGFMFAAWLPGEEYPRLGGSCYNSGMNPGRIISPGIAENPLDPSNRIFRVRPDYKTADLSDESEYEKQRKIL